MIIICPSHRRAMYEFERFIDLSEPFVREVNRKQLTVKLNGGYEYRFMSEQNSAEKLKGTHTDYMFIDVF